MLNADTLDRRVLALLRALPLVAAPVVMALGMVVLGGWIFQIEAIKRIVPGLVAMNPATAVCFILAGASLGMLALRGRRLPAGMRGVQMTLALVPAVVGTLKLITIAGGPDCRLDQILFAGQLGETSAVGVAVNRMAPNTAGLFVLSGVALVASMGAARWQRRVGMGLAMLTTFIAAVAAAGYLNGLTSLYRPTSLIPIALHTCMGFLLLGIGTLALRTAREASEGAEPAGMLERRISVGFGAALFLLAFIGFVSYASIRNYASASAASEQIRQSLGTMAELETQVIEAQTGARGYVITGQEAFLAPYERALSRVGTELKELRLLSPNDGAQLDALASLIDEHLEFTRVLVLTRRNQGREAAERLVAAAEGEQNVADIQARLAELRTRQNTTQDLSARETSFTNRVTIALIGIGSFVALLLVGASGWLVRRDLAERREVNKALRRAQADADRANEAKSNFLANMSHEIRTPMSAIIGYADLILDPRQNASDRLDYVNTIRRNGDHLLSIINDILDLSKIEAGKFQIDRTECCPCKVLSDVASLMRVRAMERQLRLEVRNEGPIPIAIRSDGARLRQILINLVGNAIKFTEEGWVRLVMKVDRKEGERTWLRFDIVDTGIGMNPEQQAMLFQPFAQVDASSTRRVGGTGLGLTICKRLAEMLGGRIEVDSFPGRGSTFTLFIDPGPLENVRFVENCKEALAGIEPGQAPVKAVQLRGRVLLVDDGVDNRRLLSVYLREAGLDVELASNGREGTDLALEVWREHKPFDVILMDMQMPELDGYGATARLRTKGYAGPVIALTAHAMAEDRARCLAAGCTDYLSKPVRRGDLLEAVARHLPDAGKRDFTPLASAANDQLVGTVHVAEAGKSRETLRSDLPDESLRHLLLAFVEELPQRVAELESCLQSGNLEQLSIKVHNLSGTGGLYGLMPISTEAAKIEMGLRERAPLEVIHRQTQELIDLIRRVEGFAQAAEKSGR